MDIREAIEKYRPCCEQEERDKAVILAFIDSAPDAFERSNLIAHMTASAWVVNPAREGADGVSQDLRLMVVDGRARRRRA